MTDRPRRKRHTKVENPRWCVKHQEVMDPCECKQIHGGVILVDCGPDCPWEGF